MSLNNIATKLLKYKDMLEKANLKTKKIPDIADSAEMGNSDERDKKMDGRLKYMNGTNVKQYNYKGEKIIQDRVPKKVADLNKKAPKGVDPIKHEKCVKDVKAEGHDIGSATAICTASMKKEEEPNMASPGNEKGDIDKKKRPITHDECGRPFAKDDIDKKIQDKLRAAMDKKGFGEADATRHIIDRDKGEKEALKPKPQPLLQTELIKFDKNGQWSLDKSNYGPKDMKLYNAKDNIQRKSNRTGIEVEGAGGNRAQKKWASGGRDSTKSQVARQAKADQAKSAANPVKIYSKEEIAALQAQRDANKKA